MWQVTNLKKINIWTKKKLSCRRGPCDAVLLKTLLRLSRLLSSFEMTPLIIIILIQMRMFIVLSSWQSQCESSPKSFDECRTAPSGRQPSDQAERLGLSPPVGCQSPHPPSPFIIITQPESWYSFYRPMEGRRLSWPSWLVTYRCRLSLISVLTGSDVVQLRWSRPMRYY